MILAARHDAILVSVRVVLLFREIAYHWCGGSRPSAAEVRADELLVWNAMLRAKETGARRFDFGGAGTPEEDYGPREFKRPFGGAETNLGRYTKALRPARLKVAETAARNSIPVLVTYGSDIPKRVPTPRAASRARFTNRNDGGSRNVDTGTSRISRRSSAVSASWRGSSRDGW